MSRTTGVLLFVGVAAVAVGLAAWALFSGGPGGGADGVKDGATTAMPGESDAAAGAPGTPRARAAAAKRNADPAADLKALAGTVTADGGGGVAGASVECYRLADDAPSDDLRRAREALRGVMDDDAEIDAMLRQMGRGGDQSTPEQLQRMARSGQRIGGRLASDTAALGRALRMGRDFGAGLEQDAALERVAATTTDAAGAFRLDGLAPGRVELRVAAPRFQRRKSRATVGDVQVKVALAPAGTVVGEVLREGLPVPGAEVRFRTATVRTGADGRFRYEAARPPREPVIASAPGCVSRGVWAKVEPGADGDEVVIDLDPAGRVTGRVASSAGAPIAGAVVSFAPDPSGLMAMFMPAFGGDSVPVPPPEAVTRADGTYEMDGVPARSVRLRADCEGWIGASAEPARVPADGVVEHVDFVLTRESVLEGRITGASGQAIADVEVRVDVPGEGIGKMMAQFGGGAFRSGRSGADGTYRVRGLSAGSRSVTVDGEGWLRQKVTLTLAVETSFRQDFTLEPGHKVAGTVVAPDGTPVANALVNVSAKSGDRAANPFMGAPTEQRSAGSGADGRFVVAGLQEGPYEITATAEKWLGASASAIPAGTEDVVLRLGAAATLRGVVTSADGTRISGATVFRQGKTPRSTGNPFLDRFARDPGVATGGDGAFEMTGVPPGSYEIHARAKGYADAAKVKVQATADAVTEGIAIVVLPGSSVSGRMTKKADGTPIGGAVVWVRTDALPFQPPEAGDILGTVPTAPADSISATTAADGTFVLDGLTPGKVSVEARAVSCAPRTIATVEVPSSNLAVEMSQGGAIEGTVYDKEGKPTEGVTVILQQGMMGGGFIRTATSARGGLFRIERIPPGTYTALLLDPDSPMGMAGAKSVAIRDGETTKQDFGKRAAGGPVEGVVLADGKPLDGATVMLIGGPGGMQIVQTGTDGKYRFDHAEAGDYSVTVQQGVMGAGGSQSGRVKVAADGSVAKLDLELSVLAVEGTVVDAETQKPVGFAQCVLLAQTTGGGGSLEEMMGRQKGQAFTDADGRFRIAGVPKGTFTLRVTAAGFAEMETDGVAGGGPPVRVAMTRGLELVVTVLGPDGKPVAGANLVPQDAGGREGSAFDITMTRTTGPDGVAKLRLQPGRYLLRATATGFPIASMQVDGTQGQATIRLEAGGTLEVVVRGAGGAPVAGATVTLLDAQGQPVREGMTMSNFLGTGGATDDQGRARREGLSPGTLKVVVTTPAGKTAAAEAKITVGATTTVELTIP